jgi:histone H3/H4
MELVNYILVINMGELPIAPIGRLIKNAGGQRVSAGAEEALEKVLEQWAEMVAMQAVKLAKHAGRVTVKASDIELAVKELA